MLVSDLLVWLLGCYGIVFLICDAHILTKPRRWVCTRSAWLSTFFSCYFCVGFWVGLATSWHTVGFDMWWGLHGFGSASFAYGLNAVILRLEQGSQEPMRFDDGANQ